MASLNANSRNARPFEGPKKALVLVVSFLLAIFALLIIRLVQFAVSQRRENLADALGMELTRYP